MRNYYLYIVLCFCEISALAQKSINYGEIFWGHKIIIGTNFEPSFYYENPYLKKIFGLSKYDTVLHYVTDNWELGVIEKRVGSVDEITYLHIDSLTKATQRLIKFMNEGYKTL